MHLLQLKRTTFLIAIKNLIAKNSVSVSMESVATLMVCIYVITE